MPVVDNSIEFKSVEFRIEWMNPHCVVTIDLKAITNILEVVATNSRTAWYVFRYSLIMTLEVAYNWMDISTAHFLQSSRIKLRIYSDQEIFNFVAFT